METIGIIGFFIGITGYILGLYRDNGKENGNYYLGSRVGVEGWGLGFGFRVYWNFGSLTCSFHFLFHYLYITLHHHFGGWLPVEEFGNAVARNLGNFCSLWRSIKWLLGTTRLNLEHEA